MSTPKMNKMNNLLIYRKIQKRQNIEKIINKKAKEKERENGFEMAKIKKKNKGNNGIFVHFFYKKEKNQERLLEEQENFNF